MSREHVGHGNIAQFAKDKVNLPKDKANEYRAQVRRLRDKLENYLKENPDFSLKKMILSGSLAKSTALRSINDIDVACYISGSDAPSDINALLDYLAERIEKAYPLESGDRITRNTYSVTVSFRGTGLDVDVVPILYYGDPLWYGNLVSQDDGSFLKTCIPRHLDFIKKRKDANKDHFAQVVRLVKFWIRKIKSENDQFRFKSFMAELILAKLADQGTDFSDYPEALQAFFTYLATSNLDDRIVFNDYYSPSTVGALPDPVQIIDPVNAENNASCLYTRQNADEIVEAALEAGDAIDGALDAPTKQETLYYWRKVFGSSFQV